jgi:hypothetical protein
MTDELLSARPGKFQDRFKCTHGKTLVCEQIQVSLVLSCLHVVHLYMETCFLHFDSLISTSKISVGLYTGLLSEETALTVYCLLSPFNRILTSPKAFHPTLYFPPVSFYLISLAIEGKSTTDHLFSSIGAVLNVLVS